MSEIITYSSRAALAEGLAAVLAGDLRAALAQGAASLAVPGGTTPAPVFEALSAQPLDWARVTVLPGDERWVPEDHPRSNAGLIRRHLLRGPAAAARLVGLYDGADSPPAAEGAVAARVAGLLPLSVLLLGMGDDAHVASLFPGRPRLAEALSPGAPPVMAMEGDPPEPRLTLTLPVLRGAARRHLLMTGAGKRAVLDAAAGRDPLEAPVAALLDGLTVHWAE